MAHLRLYLVVLFFSISLANKFLVSTPFSNAPFSKSIFLHLHCRNVRRIGRLPLSIQSSVHSSSFHFLLLLSGDIALNPGPMPTHDFRFGFTNIRSIRNKSAAISQLLVSHGMDLFGLTETWLTPSETDSFMKEITPSGYVFHHRPRSKHGGGGVGYFFREYLDCSIIKTGIFDSFEHTVLNCKINDVHYNFICIYRPPNSPTSSFRLQEILSNQFADYFIEKINKIRSFFPDLPNKSDTYQSASDHLLPTFSAFSSVDEAFVFKLIKSSPTKSCSLDAWPTYLLKEYLDIIVVSITRIVNLSLNEGIFPH